jgi:hypothetical protein
MSPPSLLSLLFEPQHYPLSHTRPSHFSRCPPLLLPCTLLVTPPTPVGRRTPLAAIQTGIPPPLPPLVRPLKTPLPPLGTPLFRNSPFAAYANPFPQSAVNPKACQCPDFRSKLLGTLCIHVRSARAFPRLEKLDFPLMRRRFPQPAAQCQPRMLSSAAVCIPHPPQRTSATTPPK